jgi:hypothetical protein
LAEPARLVDGQLDDLLGARRQADLAHCRALAAADDELDRGAHLVELYAEVGEHLRGDAVAFAHQAQQEMLSPNVVVVKPLSLFLGQG